MYRVKIFIIFLLLTLISLVTPKSSLADNAQPAGGQEFQVDTNVDYKVMDSGRTLVTHNIVLENLFSTLYATTYTLSLDNIAAENIKSNNGTTIDVQKEGTKTTIKLTFPDTVVGRGQKRNFFISYENPSFAVKTGEVWEVSIPKIEGIEAFRSYDVTLDVPVSFGQKAYISPEPINSRSSSDYNVYSFSKDDISKTGVTAGFGQFQVFSYNLSYHLENPLTKYTETQISLPPDTAFQKVYIDKIDPAPENVTVDIDGNWIATFKLSPRQRLDVTATGSVQIFAGYRHFFKPNDQTLASELKGTEFWQVDDPSIQALAKSLKTPKAIYDYVSTKLKYDYARVTPNVQRMGAIYALQNPTNSICMEFTDLFIALSRAAGIPAREINGYAYTENKDLQPLGLVADVLHSWPEYYDSDKGVWIPVDPTWASTTGGEDFFNKLDLRHFTFVIHGQSDTKPYAPGSYKLGPNPQKDVYVSFGKLSDDKLNFPQIRLDSTKEVSIENNGRTAIYNVQPKILFDGKLNSETTVEVLPPYSKFTEQIKIPFSLLGAKTPDIVSIEVGDTRASIQTNKRQIVIYSLAAVLAVVLVIFLLILIKLGKIKFNVKKIFTKSS